jgi:putative transposase
MQTELLNQKRWKTRIELANAIFDYLEIFHNRQRRHSALGMRTPIEFEVIHQSTQPVAYSPATRLHETRGTSKSPDSPGRFRAG